MILREFPELGWLKRQIDQGFRDKKGWGDLRLDREGFPSVVIYTPAKECYRPDVKGPISLFVNLRGSSRCTVDGETRVIREDTYFISNRNQPYTFAVEKGESAETFNIHFGEHFVESALNALLTPAGLTLDRGDRQELNELHFFNRLYRRDAEFDQAIQWMLRSYQQDGFNKLLFDEQLFVLLRLLVKEDRRIRTEIEALPTVRHSTRVELYKRLSHSIDYIHSAFPDAIDLATMAAAACLSKYHFLRLFKQAYGVSPYQYIQELRLTKAMRLLSGTAMPVAEIAAFLGFDNPQSFSRLFFQRMGVYPAPFRAASR
ncbi:MAG TPA: AraC family transcriptional regulator [Puia sp.]|nr:AraC family transcriptional regulator [Puia sp.]